MKNQNKKQSSDFKADKSNFGTPLIKWRAPEFAEHNRGPIWVGVMGVLVIALIIYGIISDSMIFSVVIILLAGVFFLTHNDKPKTIDISITDSGIIFGEKFFSFEEIRTFWIIFDPPHVKTLNLRVTKGVVKEVSIQLGDQNPSEIRSLLGTEIPEWKNRTETLSEILIRILKL